MWALVASRYNPIIRAFYPRMLVAGKTKKVAHTACIRNLLDILNGMLNIGSPIQARVDFKNGCSNARNVACVSNVAATRIYRTVFFSSPVTSRCNVPPG